LLRDGARDSVAKPAHGLEVFLRLLFAPELMKGEG
jgi:hypothetical protein